METWVLILMKSHLWSQASEARDILATETLKQFPQDVFFRISPRFSNLTIYYHIHEKPENGSRLKLCLWDAHLVENPIHHLMLLFPANDKQLA